MNSRLIGFELVPFAVSVTVAASLSLNVNVVPTGGLCLDALPDMRHFEANSWKLDTLGVGVVVVVVVTGVVVVVTVGTGTTAGELVAELPPYADVAVTVQVSELPTSAAATT